MNSELNQKVNVHVIPCRHPGDLSEVHLLIDKGELNPEEIIAVMGKTEGNGCVNDFARDLAINTWCQFLGDFLHCSSDVVLQRVALIMSGGTEGVLSPHFTIFTRSFDSVYISSEKRLVIGISNTRKFYPEEIGTNYQVVETAKAVHIAMLDAGLKKYEDVHLVQIKCPLLTNEKINDAIKRGKKTVTKDTYKSMGFSRGASALGVAVALGELNESEIDDSTILADFSKFSKCASVSSGIELDNNVIIVLGNLVGSNSLLKVSHSIMQDSIDILGVLNFFSKDFGVDVLQEQSNFSERLVNLFVKAEASSDGLIRGQRHTMHDDSDINSSRHARAAVGGLLSGIIGKTTLYISGGAEHQGPSGGGTIAAIVNACNEARR